MRTTFISELCELARLDKNIVLIVGDLGYNVVEDFANEFPERFFNAGIAEQSMAGMAAGLASEGFKVFVYSIANFPTFRAAEQIRNDIDYHNLSVTVVAVGGGLAYGNLGYSHHAVQDFGLMRLFPNMVIASPGDPNEVKACLRRIVELGGPHYLRLGKAGEPNFTSVVPNLDDFTLNYIAGARDSKNVILSTAGGLPYAMDFYESHKSDDLAVFTVPIWGMRYADAARTSLNKLSSIMSFEDHLTSSGFGSWLLECLTNSDGELSVKIIRRALDPKVLGVVGSQRDLNALGGLAS